MYSILQYAVNRLLVEEAMRTIHLTMINYDWHLAEDMQSWSWNLHWFPQLREYPAITNLREALPPEWKTGVKCEPQILLQFPHPKSSDSAAAPTITFHTDKEPEWAEGRKYKRIVGVALSDWHEGNGGLRIKASEKDVVIPNLTPGGAICLSPDTPHSGGINFSGRIRYGVYFRWLEEN